MAQEKRTNDKVDQYIAELPEEIQKITIALREIVLESSLELNEEFKWSMPNYSYHGLVCYIQASKQHVNLGFHKGNILQEKDEVGLLEGTGKAMRHIRIKKLEEIQPEVFASLITEAMAFNN